MSQEPPGEDLPIIDVRSPGERMADSGRAGFERVQQRLRESPLDMAALLWMVFLAGVIAIGIYSAFRSNRFDAFGESKGWITATLLTQTGSPEFAFGCMIGIGLAAWAATPLARVALVIAAVIGVWVIVANVVGIAVVFHASGGIAFTLASLTENKAVATVGQLMQCGLGAVVMLVAWTLLSSRRPGPSGPERAEVS